MRPITRHFLLFCIGLLASATSMLANPTFTIAPLPSTLTVGTVYDVKIVATNFTAIDVFQFAVDYDETKLEYQSISLGLSSFDLFTFHRTTGNRLVTFSYANVSGVTQNDGFVIATIKMKALATSTGNLNFHPGSASAPVVPEPFISMLQNGQSTPLITTIAPDGKSITGNTGNAPITGCHLIAPKDSAVVGSIITVPIKVVDFDKITTISYSLEWNPAVLSFISYDSLGVIPGFNLILNPKSLADTLSTNAIITNTNVPLGFLQTSYPDNADFGYILNGGITVPDSAVVYNMKFQVVGQAGTKSYIRLGRSGFPAVTPAPIYEDDQGEHPLQWIAGEIAIKAAPIPSKMVTFKVEKDTVLLNGNTCVNVSVVNFDSVTNFRLGIAYDQTKLTFTKFDSLPGPLNLTATGSGPNLNNPNPGEIRCVWEDLNGRSLAPNTVIYSQCFTSKGAVNTQTPVTISNFGLFVNEVGVNGKAATMVKQDGYVYVTNAVAPTVTVNSTTNISCAGGSDGAIDISASGAPNLSYAWSGPAGFTKNTEDISGLKAGTYIVTVTSSNGLTSTATRTLTQPTALALQTSNIAVTQPACFGGKGSVSIAANSVTGGTGAYSYAWTGPGGPYTTKDIANLSAGAYSLVVSDANACTVSGGTHTITAPTAISVNTSMVSTTNISCVGGANGSIILGNAVTGGSLPYASFAWSGPSGFTANTKNIAGLSNAGAYTVTITDAKACTIVAGPYMVTQPTGLQLTVSLVGTTPQSCSTGTPNGAAQITISGGTQPYTTEWKNGTFVVSNTKDLTGVAAGTYTVMVTDALGCGPATTTAVINTSSNSTMTITAASTAVTCPGGTDGGICLSVSNPTNVQTVSWSPALTPMLCPTGVAAGTYQATVIDKNGCPSLSNPIVVTQPQPLSLTVAAKTDVKCHGDETGRIVVAAAGGTTQYQSVIWNASLSGFVINGIGAGSYVPVLTDAKGCTFTGAAVTITEPPVLNITLDSVKMQDGVMANGAIYISVTGGVTPYKYKWSGGSGTSQDTTGLVAGIYNVTVTDANDCTHSMLGININAVNQLSSMITAVQGSCSGSDGCVTFSFAGGVYPLSMNWKNTTTNTSGSIVDIQDASYQACGFESGDYIFTVFDSNNTEYVMPSRNLPSLPAPIVPTVLTQPNDDFKNGEIKIFGSPSFTYNWIPSIYNGQTTLSGLDSGMYVVTITNPSNGCTSMNKFVLTRQYEPYKWQLETFVQPKCVSNCDGVLFLKATGGDAPFYKWHVQGPNGFVLDSTSDSRITINNLCAGTYSIRTTDESGVERLLDTTITAQSNLAATQEVQSDFSGFQVSGASSCDGKVKVTATSGISPYSYAWSDTNVGATNNNLCSGAYSVVIKDAIGCAVTLEGTLTSPDLIIPTVSVISDFNGYNVSCHGESNGKARIKAVGGQPPYEVEWSTGQTAILLTTNSMDDIFGLKAGSYSVTITDKNGIFTSATVQVTEPDPLQILFTEIRPQTFTQCDGLFSVTTPAAAGDVDYVWAKINSNESGTGDTIPNMCAGTVVQVTAIDANGCQAIGRDTMNYPDDGCFQLNPVITPGQADGKNDILIITCIESAKTHQLEIFNRWGQVVFATTTYDNFTNAWKGVTTKGQPLPEGVYYYVLNFTNDEGTPFQVKGYVNLLR